MTLKPILEPLSKNLHQTRDAAVLMCVATLFATNAFGVTKDFLSWPRARVDKFGCFLESEFKYKDKKFNCSLKNYVNEGDPCKNTEAYYEGVTFPTHLAKKIHPLIESIDLSWEHGELQNVSLKLNKKLSELEAQKLLNLPKDSARPSNVVSISIQQCSKKVTCVRLEGFDHMGAGDVECGN